MILITKEELIQTLRDCLKDNQSQAKEPEEAGSKILFLKDAAGFLGVAVQTMYGYTHRNTIPYYKRGKKVYFKECDLIAWLEKGRNKSIDEIQQEAKGLL